MLFNSYQYLLFFPLVFIIYFLIQKVNNRIIFLLVASYFFYMCWHPIYLVLIVASTVIDFFTGKLIGRAKDINLKKKLLSISLLTNLGILGYFKYYNFLAENIQVLLNLFNENWLLPEHHFLLPVGISFYTFQTLSYSIDVYRGQQEVEHNFFKFALFVSFFPQLVAGPIERSTSLLPQFSIKHQLDYERIKSGMVLFSWGLFKKIVIADNLAIYVDAIYDHPNRYVGLATIVATIFFSFQIYCDFSGYSDMAIGSARILGFRLMDNFKGPYASKSIREFWQRWHISLSTWFRDYLYIPLGGNRVGNFRLYFNLTLVFLVTGIWHGANWTFIVWGLFHGAFLILERVGLSRLLEKVPNFLSILYVFVVTTIGWVFFRAASVKEAVVILRNCITYDPDTFYNINIYINPIQTINLYISIFLLLAIAVLHFFEYRFSITKWIIQRSFISRWLIYTTMMVTIIVAGSYSGYKEFIYFQF